MPLKKRNLSIYFLYGLVANVLDLRHRRKRVRTPVAPLPSLLDLLYLPDPSARAGYDTRSIFKRSLIGLNSEFSFS